METQAYCVKCRKTQTVENATVKETANGRRMAQGACPVCGTEVTPFCRARRLPENSGRHIRQESVLPRMAHRWPTKMGV